MHWLRRQPSARVSTCKKDICPASHCLTQDRVGFWFDLNMGDEFRVGAFFSLVLTFLQMLFHSHSLLWTIICISEYQN